MTPLVRAQLIPPHTTRHQVRAVTAGSQDAAAASAAFAEGGSGDDDADEPTGAHRGRMLAAAHRPRSHKPPSFRSGTSSGSSSGSLGGGAVELSSGGSLGTGGSQQLKRGEEVSG